jgi:hypothetical protein
MGTTVKHIDLSDEEPGPRAIVDGIGIGGQLPLAGDKATLRATHALLLPTAVYLGLQDRRQFK